MTDTIAKPRFKSGDFGVATYKGTDWRLELKADHSMDDVSNPLLWKDITAKQTPGDTISAFKPDTGEYGKFIVLECNVGVLRLGRIESYVPAEVSVPDGQLALKWNVGKRSYDVIRKADNYVMAKDFQTKTSAAAWVNDHLAKMAA